MVRRFILKGIDFFYLPVFRRWIPLQTFRYLFCGSFSNTVDICMFFISFHFILHEKMVHLGFITISPYIAAFMMAFCISFPTGFSLSKFVVFSESNLRGRIQLFRYLLLVGACILLNYVFLKLFVEQFHIYPTIAKILTTVIVACFSFMTQKHFTFRVKEVITE
jgi:putative flippase GtrA